MDAMDFDKIIEYVEAHPASGTFLGAVVLLLLTAVGRIIWNKFSSTSDTSPIKVKQEGSPGSSSNITRDGDIQSTQTEQSPQHGGQGDMTTTYAEKVVHNYGMTPEERESYHQALEENGKLKVLHEQSQEENKKLQVELDAALDRTSQDDSPEAQSALQAIREEGDPSKLIAFLQGEREKPYSELIELNREIATVAYFSSDTKSAEEALKSILEMLPEDIDALNRMGQIQRYNGKLNDAERTYKRVLELSENNKNFEAVAIGNLGNVYTDLGHLEKAEECFLKSLSINKNLNRRDRMAGDYNNLGIVYQTRQSERDLDKAILNYKLALEIDKDLDNLVGIAGVYGNLGIIYGLQNDNENAEKNFLEALRIEKDLDRKIGIAIQLCNLGNVYSLQYDSFLMAEEKYIQALEIDDSIESKAGMASDYSGLGKLYLIHGLLKQSEDCSRKALNLNLDLSRKEGVAINLANLGMINLMMKKDSDEVRDYWQQSLQLYSEIGVQPMIEKIQGWLDDLDDEE